MHEYGVVRELVERILAALQDGPGVKEVRVRRCSTFAEGPLRQAFEMLARGTPLEGAALEVEELVVEVTCGQCGISRTVTADDLVGHFYICADCGAAREIEEAHGLELLAVTAAGPATAEGRGGG